MFAHIILLFTLCCIPLATNSFHLSANNNKKWQCILIGFCLFLFAALRGPSVGIDIGGATGYYETYSYYARIDFYEISELAYRDFLWPYFIKFLTFFSDSPQLMLIVVGGIVACSFSYFLYYQNANVLLITFLFICLRIYPFTLTGLRQSVSMSFVWLALVSLFHSKHILFFSLVFLGSLFHKSAIIFLLAYPLIKIANTKTISLSLISFAIVNVVSGNQLISLVLPYIVGNRFDAYTQHALNASAQAGSTFLIYVTMYFFACIYFKKLNESDKTFKKHFKLATVALMFSIIAQVFPNMFRIAYYFIFFLFVIFSQSIFYVFEKKYAPLIVALAILFLAAQYLFLGPGAGTDNYIFFWEE